MDTPEQREKITRLISRLLDEDVLNSEERTTLNDTLAASSEARAIYMRYIDMELEFACMVEPEAISEENLSALVKENIVPLSKPVDSDQAHRGESKWSRDVTTKQRRRWPEFAAAAAAAIFVISFAIKNIHSPASQPVIGLVENATGDVQFGSGTAAQPEEVSPGIAVTANQTIVTKGDKSSAVFVFEDGTSLVVAGDTEITTTDGAKRVTVSDGAVAASVTPQPAGKPLIVSTPVADIEVVGTRFSVNHQSDLTDLAVTQGAVVIRRHSDGSSLTVTAGKRVFAEPGGRLRLENLPTLASRWRADFEDGRRHHHCHIGEPTTHNLPGQSRGGIRASRIEETDQPGTFTEQVAFGTPWAEGLILAREKSHLHIRYKLERPGQLQIQVDTRTDGPKPQLASYQFDQFAATAAGQWVHADIPLKLFRNPATPHDQTMAGEIPLNLLVVASENAGLVVDDISLDSNGSERFESTPVE